jgi:hypothetical protein
MTADPGPDPAADPPVDPAPRGRYSYAVQARSSAPVDAVWPLVGEARRWKEWSFLDRSDLVQAGAPAPDGVGAIRRFTNHGIGSREEVVAWDPPHHLGYAILSGFPVRHYRSDVTLTPDGNDGSGTLIAWSGTFEERIPGTGRLLEHVLSRLMTKFATSLAGYADHHHAV